MQFPKTFMGQRTLRTTKSHKTSQAVIKTCFTLAFRNSSKLHLLRVLFSQCKAAVVASSSSVDVGGQESAVTGQDLATLFTASPCFNMSAQTRQDGSSVDKDHYSLRVSAAALSHC